MKLSYEPNLAAGGAMGAIMALFVYYKVLDLEAAGLWAVALAAIAPVMQGYVARFFTTPTAKLTDAAHVDDSYDAETIDQKARQGRRQKQTAKEGSSV